MRAAAWTLCLAMVLALGGCGREASPAPRPQPEPEAGAWRTRVLTSPEQFPVPPPPAPGSEQAKAELEELRALADGRSPEIAEIVGRWDQLPPNRPWTELNLGYVAARAKDPPLASRGYALVSVAVYDALVAAWHYKYVYDRPPPEGIPTLSKQGPDPSYPSEHAVIAGAASRVLAYLFPERPAARLDQMAEEAALSRLTAGTNYRSDIEAGLALGRQVADAVIAWGRADGSERPWDGTRPPHGVEFWEPPPGSVSPPVQPLAGTWRTWVLASGSQLRPSPPPPIGSPENLAEAREVMRTRDELTPEQERIARYWEGGEGTSLPPGIWNEVALAYAARDRLSTPRSARLFALLNVSQADAGVAAWDAKYVYWYPRPENAIRDLVDPNWTPLLDTPLFPAYVSGHAVYSGAAGEVMGYLFPAEIEHFRARAEDAANSRVYGGIHWPVDSEGGLPMGREIGRLVVEWARGDGSN